MRKPKVTLDPGHGGKDPGASANGLVEKNMALVAALEAKRVLEEHGVEVILTRDKDVYVELSDRSALANKWGADIFVSIHFNAGGGDGAEAIHSIFYGEAEQLAKAIINRIHKDLGQNLRPHPTYTRVNSRGTDYYAVIRGSKMPAVIVEPAFVDSKDAQLVDTIEEQKKVGRVIAYGILDFLKIPVKPEQPKPAPAPAKKPASSVETGVVTADELNVRTGPGTEYKVVTKLKKGQQVKVLEKLSNGWLKIEVAKSVDSRGFAYVSGKYVKM